MNKQAAGVATVSDITPTPYIAVAANFFGTGDSAQSARRALVAAGGSPQEDQTVFKLPDGAVGAFVADTGAIHWRGVESGDATPVYRYKHGKSVKVIASSQAWKAPTKKTKAKQPENAQNLGEVHPDPEVKGDGSDDPGASTDDKETTIATVPAKPKRVRHKPGSLPTFVVGDKVRWESGPMANRVTKLGDVTHVIPSGSQPEAGTVREPGAPRTVESYVVKSGNKSYWPHTSALSKADTLAVIPTTGEVVEPATPGAVEVPAAPQTELPLATPAIEPAVEPTVTEAQPEPTPAVVEEVPKAKPVKAKKDKPAKPATEPKPAKEPKTDKPVEVADFLLFVGGSFYSKEEFITESSTLGISRRMPSHKLPKGLISGKSRVYVATSGARKFEGEPEGEVFGYFIPERVEFISTEGNEQHADIIASLQLRPDSKIVTTITGEAERECGTRVEGGTYIVVDKGDSPLHQLDKSAKYVGNHFRGLLKLSPDQVETFNSGGSVATLIDEVCMCCGAAMKCAPDGHARAERERRRIDKGDAPKWRLQCTKCQAQVRAERRAAQAADGADSTDEPTGTDEAVSEADDAMDGDEGQPQE